MEDFECPPQDDAPILGVDAELFAERHRARLLENARAVIPAVLTRWAVRMGNDGIDADDRIEIVVEAFNYAELMLAEAEKRKIVYRSLLKGAPVPPVAESPQGDS